MMARKQASPACPEASGVEPFEERAAIEDAGERICLRAPLRLRQREPLRTQSIRHAEGDQHRRRDHRQGEAVVIQQRARVHRTGDQESHRSSDGETLEQTPGDQEPSGRPITPAPGKKYHGHREHG